MLISVQKLRKSAYLLNSFSLTCLRGFSEKDIMPILPYMVLINNNIIIIYKKHAHT